MDYIARHYHMDFPLVWALRLEGKIDQKKFKELGWGVRTWDQWNFNECQSFDIATRDNRPEIQYHHRDSRDNDWPITGKTDLIFFDPPYYIKKEGAIHFATLNDKL